VSKVRLMSLLRNSIKMNRGVIQMRETNFILVENSYGDTRVHEFETIEDALEGWEQNAEGSSPPANLYAVCEMTVEMRAALKDTSNG
jgi:hypothetical protein